MPECKEEKDVSEIVPNLWLGNYKAAISKTFLTKFNIKYIVNITPNVPNVFPHIEYFHIPVRDDDTCNKDLNKAFDGSTEFILNGLKNGTGVLVHCMRGHHRSASVVVAFLMRYLDVEYLRAVTYINSLRKCALVRDTCMTNALFAYSVHLRSSIADGQDCNCLSCNMQNVTVFNIL
jgi:hypothetical protein